MMGRLNHEQEQFFIHLGLMRRWLRITRSARSLRLSI
jgi:hypothetical protein